MRRGLIRLAGAAIPVIAAVMVSAAPASAGCVEKACPPPPPPPPPPVCSPIGCPPPEPPVCVEPNCAPPVDTCNEFGSTGVPSVDCMWVNMDETNPVGGAEAHADMLDGYAYNAGATAVVGAESAIPDICVTEVPCHSPGPLGQR